MRREIDIERSKTILIEVVRLYIQKGDPISSKLLKDYLPFKVSSATIRNILNRLEREGYLYQPHISAGRIPTDKGYRFYVDYLKNVKLKTRDKEAVNSILMTNVPFDELMDDAAKMLSNITKNVAIVLIPDYARMIMRHIDFIKLSSEKILVILVTHTGSVLKKIIEFREQISQDELIRISNYLNENFQGKNLLEIREQILILMKIERFKYDVLKRKAFYIAQQSLTSDLIGPKIYIEGTANIIDSVAKEDSEQVYRILSALEEKTIILDLLNKTMEKDGLHIYIGSESEIKVLKDVALVLSTYNITMTAKGCIGVLGPRRMYYDRIIPLVSYIGKNFNNLIKV